MRSFIRLFVKRKGYYVTNILGLTVGLAAAGFSILYFEHELGYDSFHPQAGRIYRVSSQYEDGWFASLNIKYVNALRQDTIPAIEELTRLRRWYSKFVFVGDQKFYESKLMLTDPGSRFFTLFNFPFKEGVAATSLDRENSVVLSSSLAKKYFGDKPALGESLEYDTMALTVTGVFEDLPSNTTFPFEMLVCNQRAMDQASGSYTFALLKPGTDIPALEKKILQANVGAIHQKVVGIKLLPIEDLHYDGTFIYEMKPAGNRSYLWVLGAIGATILLIAFTNFINLAVALYARRSREIAVRKSVGASSGLLSKQFLLESLLTITVALTLAVLLIYLLMPAFNSLMELRLQDPLSSMPFLTGMGLVLIAMTLAAGTYPALILPRIHILDLFKQTGIATHHGITLRMFLLGFQLVVLFFVCCALWVIHGQFNFIKNKDVGFSKEGVIKIKRAGLIDSARYHTLKTEFLQHPSIQAVSQGFAPGDEDYGYNFSGENGERMDGLLFHGTEYDYLKVLDLKVLEGPAIDGTTPLPNRSRLINETLAKMLGYENPVGRKISIYHGDDAPNVYTIDGVVADYHFNSLHHAMVPIILSLRPQSSDIEQNILVKVNTANVVESVEFIQERLNKIVPDIPVEIGFLEADLEKLYKHETQLSKVVIILVAVSVILSVVGLIALCSYMIEYRQREIAIRKVLGATTVGIVSIFARVFGSTTLVSFILATPLCWIAMDSWLQGFAYRGQIEVLWFIYVLMGILAITIGLAVVQTAKAASDNPTKMLRD